MWLKNKTKNRQLNEIRKMMDEQNENINKQMDYKNEPNRNSGTEKDNN